ncbi:MAG TPA: arylsulfotransferase family protein [Gemmatirosa sp.]
MRRSSFARVLQHCTAALVAGAAAACSDRPTPVEPAVRVAVRPTVGTVAVVADTANALQLVVHFTVSAADSARVLYRRGTNAEQASRALTVTDSASVPLLAVQPGTSVTARVVAFRGAATDTSAPVSATNTAAVPDVVRRVRFATTTGHASPGYLLTAVEIGDTSYAVAFDSTGTVAWYRQFAGVPGAIDAYQQPNGDVTVFLGSSASNPLAIGKFAEVRPGGTLVREWAAPSGFSTDPHELRLDAGAGSSSYVFGFDSAPMDFTARGGTADSSVVGHTIFRLDATGAATSIFVARDHFTVADWIDPEQGITDFDHPNAIDVDRDGGLIISWRNFDEVSKIDPVTGQFVWRLGGRHNQFTFVNDPLNGFGGQHFARLLANGNLLLYDNGTTHAPQETRAAEYRLDLGAHTATLVWQFRHQPTIFTPYVGSTQRLASGHTFIGYAGVGIATEVTSAGAVVWEGQLTLDGNNAQVYRLLKIAALGHYAAP